MKILEICCDSVASALAASRGGADRIELCSNLAQGGLTPSAAMIKQAKSLLNIPVFVLIRPRKADFLYSDMEFECLLEDIWLAKQLGADGVVSGALLQDGSVDLDRIAIMVKAADPLPFTLHRAFDMCINPIEAIPKLAAIGVKRILSSGQMPTANEGYNNLQRFANAAQGKLEIMACGELLPENIEHISNIPGINELHSAALGIVESKMTFRGRTNMGDEAVSEEFRWREVNEALVRGMKEKLTLNPAP